MLASTTTTSRPSHRLHGVLPIVHVPLTADDRIDRHSFRRSIDWAFAVGAVGMGTGMVSEILRLTSAERLELTELLVESVAGRGPVFAAVGAESTRQSLEYAAAAERAGCDGVMAVPPLMTRLSVDAMVAHYRTLAEGVGIPIIVQDASGYVGQSIPLAVCVELLERYGSEKIVFKPEGSPIGPQLSALRDATDGRARIFEGSGGILLVDSYRRGIAGTMPGMDLLDAVVLLWQALERHDDDSAYRLSFPISAIVALQLQAGLDGFLAIEKHLMVRRGLFADARRRRPYSWDPDPETLAEVDRLFERLEHAVRSASAARPKS